MRIVVKLLCLGFIAGFWSGCRAADSRGADAGLQVYASPIELTSNDAQLVGKETQFLPKDVLLAGFALQVQSAETVSGLDALPAVELKLADKEAKRLHELMTANEGGTIFLALGSTIVSVSPLSHISLGKTYLVPLQGNLEDRQAIAGRIVQSVGRQ